MMRLVGALLLGVQVAWSEDERCSRIVGGLYSIHDSSADHVDAAISLAEAGELPLARRSFLAATVHTPDRVAAWVNYGLASLESGDAMEAWRSAVAAREAVERSGEVSYSEAVSDLLLEAAEALDLRASTSEEIDLALAAFEYCALKTEGRLPSSAAVKRALLRVSKRGGDLRAAVGDMDAAVLQKRGASDLDCATRRCELGPRIGDALGGRLGKASVLKARHDLLQFRYLASLEATASLGEEFGAAAAAYERVLSANPAAPNSYSAAELAGVERWSRPGSARPNGGAS